MDNYIYVGKINNTFGIKGEVKLISDFEYKNKIFIKDFNVYIGMNKDKLIINTYRVHKDIDMLTFNNINNINDILKYKGMNIYIKRDDLKLNKDEYLLNDLIGFEVYDNNKLIGIIMDYDIGKSYTLFKVKGEKVFFIPNIKEYIKDIDINNKRIITNKGSELIL